MKKISIFWWIAQIHDAGCNLNFRHDACSQASTNSKDLVKLSDIDNLTKSLQMYCMKISNHSCTQGKLMLLSHVLHVSSNSN